MLTFREKRGIIWKPSDTAGHERGQMKEFEKNKVVLWKIFRKKFLTLRIWCDIIDRLFWESESLLKKKWKKFLTNGIEYGMMNTRWWAERFWSERCTLKIKQCKKSLIALSTRKKGFLRVGWNADYNIRFHFEICFETD